METNNLKSEYYTYVVMNGLADLEDAIDLDIMTFEEFCKKHKVKEI